MLKRTQKAQPDGKQTLKRMEYLRSTLCNQIHMNGQVEGVNCKDDRRSQVFFDSKGSHLKVQNTAYTTVPRQQVHANISTK